MSFLYNISIYLYSFIIHFASFLNTKARLWINGRKDIFSRISEAVENEPSGETRKIAWFHCASLGEFEQGKPVIEAFRSRFPGYKIFLTFFSPSGYEVRKNYKDADYIFYLPADTKHNAERFISLVNPQIVFFIKYEYWYNYLRNLYQKKIPFYIISAIFRPGQHFFKWYGSWFRDQIKQVNWFFLQDHESATLLLKIGINTFSITGDTRFDRVYAIARQVHSYPLIEKFCGDSQVILAGSSWAEDEEILFPMMNKSGSSLRFIIAPHETHPARISSLISRLKIPALRYSEANSENIHDFRVLIIDCIGILAHLYQYPFIAYIGGGFGSGIHNILEAAAFGVPVVFGPNYKKFREARDLISLGGAFTISDANQFIQITNHLLSMPEEYSECAEICYKYILEHQGATEKIMEKIHG
jgi:3-deoxy-D-manno-octulosonic-acid transferase